MSKFKIISRPLGTVQCYVLKRDDGAEFEVLSGFGAGLNAWRVPSKQAAGNSNGSASNGLLDLLFGYRDGSTLHKIAPDTNAGCRLAPFPGRVAFAKFNWNGKDYQLVNNVSWAPHALHGFLTNREWNFVEFESDSEKCTATFTCDWPGAFAGFPFPFRATNKITFTGESFTVESTVKNIGKATMPYSEGWHPYFSLGQKIDELTMGLPESDFAELDKADIPTGNFHADKRFVGGRAIGDEFINDCFCLGTDFAGKEADSLGTDFASKKAGCLGTDFASKKAGCLGTDFASKEAGCQDGRAEVTLQGANGKITYWQQAGHEQYNAIQIYTPPDRMSIAIEPMTAEPDALNHHRGLIEIPAGESRTFTFGATFKNP